MQLSKKKLWLSTTAAAICIAIALTAVLCSMFVIPQNLKSGIKEDKRIFFEYADYKPYLFKKDDVTMAYRFKKPDITSEEQKFPLLIFLHGNGSQGTDNRKQVFGDFIEPLEIYGKDCFVLIPQGNAGTRWDDYNGTDFSYMLDALLEEEILINQHVDLKRIYIVGASMGGWGVAHQIMRNYDRFAAATIICGGNDDTNFDAWKNIPLWVAHGAKDEAVPIKHAHELVDGILNVGGRKLKYTEYPDLGHDIMRTFLNNSEVWNWMFAQQK